MTQSFFLFDKNEIQCCIPVKAKTAKMTSTILDDMIEGDEEEEDGGGKKKFQGQFLFLGFAFKKVTKKKRNT